MKSTAIVALTAVTLGVGALVTRAIMPTIASGNTSASANKDSQSKSLPLPPPGGPQPSASTDREEFDFGRIAVHGRKRHDFHITNTGGYPLELRSGGTTCLKCTIGKLGNEKVLPGETATVTIEYVADDEIGEFRQSAVILSNAPEHPRITFTISGTAWAPVRVDPPSVAFSGLSQDDTRSAELHVFGYLNRKFKITGHALLDGELAPLFDVERRRLSEEELVEPNAKVGYFVRVTVKPGLPVGPFHQRLLLQSNEPTSPSIEIPIDGNVAGDISIYGPGWNEDSGILTLGAIPRKSGVKRALWILIRGMHRHDVQFRLAKSTTDALNVTFGDAVDLKGTSFVRVPLNIEIPPGASRVNFLQDAAELFLETTHPSAKKLRLQVHFIIEG